MNEKVRWTNLKDSQLVKLFGQKGLQTSRFIVRQVPKMKGLVQRKMSKTMTIKEVENRNEQFENIKQIKAKFVNRGWPILSVATKKKECIGQFYRAGKSYYKEKRKVYDHDFASLAAGRVGPHGSYEGGANKGYLSIGKSKDTAEILCDNLRYHWQNRIQKEYPEADEMLLLMDGGGSNSRRHYSVKEDWQKLANELGMKITIAHYPAYCAKDNPIEHRLFPHLQRSWDAIVFENYDIVKARAEQTTTETGLKVVAWINEKVYQTGRKYSDNFKETRPLKFDEILPQWNYQILPF